MSTDTVCPNCGAEHDTRHDGCPACTVRMTIRECSPPYKEVSVSGYLRFEIHGEQFAVTEALRPINPFQRWGVTHVDTGARVPGVIAATRKEAQTKGRKFLEKHGPEALQRALGKTRDTIAKGNP